jgi:hypothetical protein
LSYRRRHRRRRRRRRRRRCRIQDNRVVCVTDSGTDPPSICVGC